MESISKEYTSVNLHVEEKEEEGGRRRGEEEEKWRCQWRWLQSKGHEMVGKAMRSKPFC